MTNVTKIGSEFLVNTYTENGQQWCATSGLADGRFVVVWEGPGAPMDGDSTQNIHAQLFNADGSKSGGEFLVNTTTNNGQLTPSVTTLTDGRFVVSWTDISTGNYDIRAQVFNADGTKSGTEFVANTTTANSQWDSAVTALPEGKFVVTWEHNNGANFDIRAQVFNADGSKSGAEFTVNTMLADDQLDPAITGLSDGRLVTAFVKYNGGDGSGTSIRAQIRNQDGSASSAEFTVNTTSLQNQHAPTIVELADGRFVVAWQDFSALVWDIRAQVFNPDGTKSGVEFLVNTTTAAHQQQPVIAALPDGGFVAAWLDESQTGGDTSSSAIRAQVFDGDGNKTGGEFLVNTTTTNGQVLPAIAVLDGGRFAVTWQDLSQVVGDTSNWAIRGQIFDTTPDPTPPGPTPDARADFDGSGTSDILWQHSNGTVGQWLMNDGLSPVTAALPGGSAAWHAEGLADFNGDGRSDILWRHDDGTVATWHMDGSNTLSTQTFGNAPLDWHIQGTGDFNGDGKGDILWRQDGGNVGTWHMDGATQLSTQSFANAPPDWHIQGTGDFNGDGKDDLLWRHDGGDIGTWHMDGAQVLSTQTFANAPNQWHLEGTGDFNGDGKDDLLWRHDDGTVGTWHMNGAQVLSTQTFANAPNEWHIEGTGDFNGDGTDDVLWRHDNGTVATWEMDGANVLATHDYGAVAADWHIVGNHYEFI